MTIFAFDLLKGEHALITGATGGIGYETAKILASIGSSITITGRRKEKLQQLQNEIIQKNPNANVFVYAADLNDQTDRENLIEAAIKEIGYISLLVNSAGITGGNTVDKLTKQEVQEMMDLNYTSTVMVTQLVYKKMKEQRKGAVVNVSSLSGLRGTYGNTAYAASKFALTGFTQSMAVEAIKYGVRVNSVCPGYVDTEMGREAIERKANLTATTFRNQMETVKKGIPSERITAPCEVANTIVFLLSNAAKNIVGESIKISGGSVLH